MYLCWVVFNQVGLWRFCDIYCYSDIVTDGFCVPIVVMYLVREISVFVC